MTVTPKCYYSKIIPKFHAIELAQKLLKIRVFHQVFDKSADKSADFLLHKIPRQDRSKAMEFENDKRSDFSELLANRKAI